MSGKSAERQQSTHKYIAGIDSETKQLNKLPGTDNVQNKLGHGYHVLKGRIPDSHLTKRDK